MPNDLQVSSSNGAANAPQALPAETAALPQPGEGCPAPLAWQSVLQEFQEGSSSWSFQQNGVEVTGRTWGQGRLLIFVNHFTGTANLYALLAYLLRDEFQTVVYNIRGDGSSSRRTMHDYSEDLWRIADRHQTDCFDVYGASFGAAVALQATIDRPSRIRHLMLQQGCARRSLSMLERLVARWCGLSKRNFGEWPFARRIQIANNRPWFPSLDPTRGQFLLDATAELQLKDLARRAIVHDRFDVRQQLGEVQVPMLLIYTEGQGTQAEQAQRELERLQGRAVAEWLHSAGQHPYLTHPHRIAKVIRSFAGEPNRPAEIASNHALAPKN